MQLNPSYDIPRNSGAREKRRRRSIRADHLEHVFRLDLEIVAAATGPDDRAGQPGLVDAILDEGLVDVHGDNFAQRQPGLRLVRSMVARFQTNSPVSWILPALSFQFVEEKPMIGGW